MIKSKFALTKKPIGEMTNRDLVLLRGAALRICTKKGRPDLHEDLVSFCLMILSERGQFYYNIHWMWGMFMKREQGNITNKKGLAKATGRSKGRVSLTKVVKAMDEGKAAEYELIDKKPLPDTSDPFNVAFDLLEREQRAVIVLRSKWGFTLDEVAEVIGVTRERIRQIEFKAEISLQKNARLGRIAL